MQCKQKYIIFQTRESLMTNFSTAKVENVCFEKHLCHLITIATRLCCLLKVSSISAAAVVEVEVTMRKRHAFM
jgi:hypothetical protein